MQFEWDTRQLDLQDAKKIIEDYKVLNQGKPLKMIDFIIRENEPLRMQRPDWIVEIAEFFDNKYGVDKGYSITALVLNQLVLQSKTIH